MNKRFNYEKWYNQQNNKKSNLLYERLTTQFVGRNILREQQEQAILNYNLSSNKELMDKTKKIVGEKLSTFLGIDTGTTEGQYVVDLAAKFVLNHAIDLQIKGQEKSIEKNPSMIKDLGELLKAIVVNAAHENKEMFKQFSSVSRAKAGAEVLGKKIGSDVEEFGSELGRTGKQAFSDIKSGISNLFEAAPQAAAAAGAGAAGTAIVAGTAAAVTETAAVVAPAAVAAATTSAKIIAGAAATQAVAAAGASVTFALIKIGVITTLGLAAIGAILRSAGLVNLGLEKVTSKAETAAGKKAPGIFDFWFSDEDDNEDVASAPAASGKKDKKIKSKGKKSLDPSKVGTTTY